MVGKGIRKWKHALNGLARGAGMVTSHAKAQRTLRIRSVAEAKCQLKILLADILLGNRSFLYSLIERVPCIKLLVNFMEDLFEHPFISFIHLIHPRRGFSKEESYAGAGKASLKNPQKHGLNNGKNSTKAGKAAKQKHPRRVGLPRLCLSVSPSHRRRGFVGRCFLWKSRLKRDVCSVNFISITDR